MHFENSMDLFNNFVECGQQMVTESYSQKNFKSSAAPLFTNCFNMYDIATSGISKEDLGATLIQTEKTFQGSPPKTKSNLDDILGDFSMTNAKINRILKPDKPEQRSSASNNDGERPESQPDMNPKSKFNVSKSSYNSAFFDHNTSASSTTFTSNTKDMNDIFGDILNEQGYTFTNKMSETPVSINDLYKKDLIAQKGPEEAKLMEWSKGKKNNIRALLCTLHTVLWSDAKWQKCEMSQVVNPSDVKKNYRKACLAVHPDKHNGTENEHVAKLIFMELNQAWSNFENDSAQQRLFS